MKCCQESEERKKRKVLNIVELGELVYIRLEDGKRYLLNGDGCWRCGSTADCFGNMMDGDELEVICELDFFEEVRSLFLCLLQDWTVRSVGSLNKRISGRICRIMESIVDMFSRVIEGVNTMKRF